MAKAKDGSWASPQTAVGAGVGNGGLCATVVNTDTTCPTVQGLLMRRPLKAIDKKEGNQDQVWDFAGQHGDLPYWVCCKVQAAGGKGAAQVAPRQQKKKCMAMNFYKGTEAK